MKITVFCGWGEASDVGMNIERTPVEAARSPGLLVPVDLTSDEARKLAAELIACADGADKLQRQYCEYVTREREAGPDDEG